MVQITFTSNILNVPLPKSLEKGKGFDMIELTRPKRSGMLQMCDGPNTRGKLKRKGVRGGRNYGVREERRL